MNLFEEFQSSFEEEQEIEMSLMDYLMLCKQESLAYATAPERVLAAIGVLIFIDQQMTYAALPVAQHFAMLFEQLYRQTNEVIKVDRLIGA